MITIAILITTILQHIKAYIQEIPGIARKVIQAVKSTTTKISRNNFHQNIREAYKSTALAITIVTKTTDYTSHMKQHKATNRNTQNTPDMQKLNDEYDKSYQSYTARTFNDNHD